MARTAKFFVLMSWALFVSAYFLSGSLRQETTVSAFTGPAQIYAAHCAKCHGADGRAKTGKGKRTGATDFTSDWNRDEARGIRIITNGKSEMPSFKRKLTGDEIRSVFNYVLRFR